MKIQFEFGMPSHERHFQTVLDELEARGHELIKTACTKDCPGLVKRNVKASDHRELVAFHAYVRNDEWQSVSYAVRTARDYIRYLFPEHGSSTIIKNRVRNMLSLGFEGCAFDAGSDFEVILGKCDTEDALWSFDKALDQFEASIPPNREVLDYVSRLAPDILCITPMIMTQYGQAELVKAARHLRIPVVFLANSWDNLTTKGAVHVMPDVTVVWNDVQKQEAARYHRIPCESVLVAGAPRFDDFWDRKIEIPRANYCRNFGFDASQSIITYLCSSNLISRDEKDFVARWVDAIRNSASPGLASANILIRPHPKFSDGWEERFSGAKAVAVSISKGLNNDPVLFHCLAHSRAVVGANTSAELEAAILNVPVFTVHDSDLASGQKGTIHFGYLAGPLATVAGNLHEHILQLETELATPLAPGRNDAFLKSFLRPHGLDIRPTNIISDYLQSMTASGKRSDQKSKPLPGIFSRLGNILNTKNNAS